MALTKALYQLLPRIVKTAFVIRLIEEIAMVIDFGYANMQGIPTGATMLHKDDLIVLKARTNPEVLKRSGSGKLLN